MKGLFKEKLDFYKAEFRTREGIWDFLIGSFIWGLIIISYINQINNFIVSFLSFIPNEILRNYIGYLVFGLFSWSLGLTITFILNKIYRFLFKK